MSMLRVLLFCNYLNIFAYSLFAPLYALFVLDIGGSGWHVGASFGVHAVAAGLLMFVFGRLEDRTYNRHTMLVIGYFTLALGALSFLLISNVVHLYLVQLFNAVGLGIVTPAYKTLYAKAEDKGKESEQWALFDGGNHILASFGAFLGGIAITYGSFSLIFMGMAGIQFISAFGSLYLLE